MPVEVGSVSVRRFRGRDLESKLGHIFKEIDHRILSRVILPLPLTEGQLSVTGKRTCIQSTGQLL